MIGIKDKLVSNHQQFVFQKETTKVDEKPQSKLIFSGQTERQLEISVLKIYTQTWKLKITLLNNSRKKNKTTMTRLFEKYNNDYMTLWNFKVSLKLPSRANAPLTRRNKNI